MFDKEVTLKAIDAFERLMARLNSKRLLTFFLYLAFLLMATNNRAIELGTLAYVLTSLLVWRGNDELGKIDNSAVNVDNKQS